MALDLQPDDPAGRISSLQHYDFVSSEARERFEELVEELRREMADTFFEGASDALSNMSPEQMARMRDAYDALNQMLEQRERGDELDPSFEEFMEQYGDMFPGNPQTLDELLEQLAERMAAAQAVWNSLSPEQQAQLQRAHGGRARGHGPALAGGAPGPEPPARRPRRRLAARPTTSTARAR